MVAGGCALFNRYNNIAGIGGDLAPSTGSGGNPHTARIGVSNKHFSGEQTALNVAGIGDNRQRDGITSVEHNGAGISIDGNRFARNDVIQ